MGDLATPIDERLRAGEPACIDILPLQMIFEAAKSRRRHADGFEVPDDAVSVCDGIDIPRWMVEGWLAEIRTEFPSGVSAARR